MNKKDIPNDIIRWWESKRWLFNLGNGLFGVLGLILFAGYFKLGEAIGLIIYAIVGNIFFSTGMLLEIVDFYYLNNKLGFNKFRLLFLIMGLLFSYSVTFIGVIIHYTNI
ncbi:hypothetical protein [Psychroserpens sp. NJDZ02]|uniref:hypothetical protein n=1 Tax=Psychroserpens sp. NJDZ02 TaxID=2570561 RepID=UPI0010A86AEA|nr:hypothetical protein [Psychroserpens sp. NJDZ02]QCE41960.1 hypothetical protein E9099_11225 [Psychroserpens sp. NJDZ02]